MANSEEFALKGVSGLCTCVFELNMYLTVNEKKFRISVQISTHIDKQH